MERIELYPIFNRYTVCNDHYDGELEYPGDALGRDCMIAAYLPEKLGLMRKRQVKFGRKPMNAIG